jgi:hypothetical protein
MIVNTKMQGASFRSSALMFTVTAACSPIAMNARLPPGCARTRARPDRAVMKIPGCGAARAG